MYVYITCADAQGGQETPEILELGHWWLWATYMMWLLELNSGSVEAAALLLKSKMGLKMGLIYILFININKFPCWDLKNIIVKHGKLKEVPLVFCV